MKGRWCLALVLSLLAFQAAVGQARNQASPLKYIMVSVQPTNSADAGRVQVETALVSGFNSVRVIMPWTYPNQAEVLNDWRRLCNVAAPAAEHQMSLFLNLVPPYGKNPKPPTTSSQIRMYNQTLNEYLHHLAGEHGCAKGLREIVVQVANEPNYEVFWPQAAAAEEYTRLLIGAYKFIRRLTEKHEFNVPVLVAGGELASSHDPVGFMNRMRSEAKKLRYRGPFFDMFSYHCYGTGGASMTMPDSIQSALVAGFGPGIPLLCTEFADASPTQGIQYCQAISMVVSRGLDGFGWFRLFDDPVPLYTGIYYYNPALGQQAYQPVGKPSLQRVRYANASAAIGAAGCG